MEDIQIPMLHGNMEDISAQESSTMESSMDSSSVAAQQIYDREARITIDYSQLNASYKDFEDDEVKKYGDKLAKAISDASLTLQKIQAPNMKKDQFCEMELFRGYEESVSEQ
ncbi:Structural maintenance of chromosomes protein 1B [Homalodisca vitripennis]|nr:Structural maintenance of chromosomes protein 1B [Homalodisca vitripennis]